MLLSLCSFPSLFSQYLLDEITSNYKIKFCCGDEFAKPFELLLLGRAVTENRFNVYCYASCLPTCNCIQISWVPI